MRKCGCKCEIYMTTKLTVATVTEKMIVTFCKLFFSETNSEKWKKSFTTCDLRRFATKQTGPESAFVLHHRSSAKEYSHCGPEIIGVVYISSLNSVETIISLITNYEIFIFLTGSWCGKWDDNWHWSYINELSIVNNI